MKGQPSRLESGRKTCLITPTRELNSDEHDNNKNSYSNNNNNNNNRRFIIKPLQMIEWRTQIKSPKPRIRTQELMNQLEFVYIYSYIG